MNIERVTQIRLVSFERAPFRIFQITSWEKALSLPYDFT